jgi:hypothetical protein
MRRVGDGTRETDAPDLFGGAPYRVGIARAHAHPDTRSGERLGDGEADSARGAGDDGGPALKSVRRRHPRTVS